MQLNFSKALKILLLGIIIVFAKFIVLDCIAYCLLTFSYIIENKAFLSDI